MPVFNHQNINTVSHIRTLRLIILHTKIKAHVHAHHHTHHNTCSLRICHTIPLLKSNILLSDKTSANNKHNNCKSLFSQYFFTILRVFSKNTQIQLHNSTIVWANILADATSSSTTANSSAPCIRVSVPGNTAPKATPFFKSCT